MLPSANQIFDRIKRSET